MRSLKLFAVGFLWVTLTVLLTAPILILLFAMFLAEKVDNYSEFLFECISNLLTKMKSLYHRL